MPCSDYVADLAFVFDGSDDVGLPTFNAQLIFACNIVKQLHLIRVGGDDTTSQLSVGSIMFSDHATIAFDFTSESADNICSKITGIGYNPGDFTRLHTGLELFREVLATSPRGFRGPLQGVPTELVILSHGTSMDSSKLVAELRLLETMKVSRTVVSTASTGGDAESLFLSVLAGTDGTLAGALDSAETDLELAKEIASSIASRVPCSTSCTVSADIVFVVDRSTSIELLSAGGAPGNFRLLGEFAAEVVAGLSDHIASDDVRIAALTVADDAKAEFSLTSFKTNPDMAENALREFSYNHEANGGDFVTATNLDKALALVRTQVFTKHEGSRTSASKFIVILSDGKVRNDENTAAENLETELGIVDPEITRFAFGIGAKVSQVGLLTIAGSSGSIGVVTDPGAADSIIRTISERASSCILRNALDDEALPATTKGPVESTKVPSTAAPIVDTCTALDPYSHQGCNNLIAALGCTNSVTRMLCAQACTICADFCSLSSSTFYDECVRCADGKYLFGTNCIDASGCPASTIAVQSDDDSMYGRACVAVGGTCDYMSATASCKPPTRLTGHCESAIVHGPGDLECTRCKMNFFLTEGRCKPNVACYGSKLNQNEDIRCNCNSIDKIGEVNNDCSVCSINFDETRGHQLTGSWPGKYLRDDQGGRAFSICTKCRNGKVLTKNGMCIDIEACPIDQTAYMSHPKKGGTCETPFACDFGIKSTTGDNCACPRGSMCGKCLYSAGGRGEATCLECKLGKAGQFGWLMDTNKRGKSRCLRPSTCFHIGKIGAVIDGVGVCVQP
jgi:hypothetical protein